MTRKQALSFRASNTVILTGHPTFHPRAGRMITDGVILKPSATFFTMSSDAQSIGAITVTDTKYDIFDPKAESV